MFISSSAAAAAAGIHVIGCMRLRDVGVIQTFALFGSKPASKPKTTTGKVVKEKTVDGIFGTSGGIGFTKANELFVGRVAMFGFAVHFRFSLSLSLSLSLCLSVRLVL
jgi:hypothetical protein